MKKILFTAAVAAMFILGGAAASGQTTMKNMKDGGKSLAPSEKPVSISEADYKTKIEDFTTEEWKYLGEGPAVVDFYADWCGPCRRLAPVIDQLASEYKGKVTFYKVNVDNAKDLSKAYGIQSIPTLFFIPSSGKPEKIVGGRSKEELVKKIEEMISGK